MTPARFQEIEEIFHTALEQKPGQVNAFLDTACQGDKHLRSEVEALLNSHERASEFIEDSAADLVKKVIDDERAGMLIGETIGHYRISELIGTGGMGEVYLAFDIKAGRKAALKLLPTRLTGDAECLKRFQQEAHAVVALNHPNIFTVYEIGEADSNHYIASELIEGETLRQRLARRHIPLAEAIEISIQVAGALAAAHQVGIVHRDIKPENIMLRPDGYVKVLDFGIAKLAEQEVPTTIPAEEALLLVETNLGSVLGTVRYMSPEQARGRSVDKSTDIWSIGVLLYEMVTGCAPFTGDTAKEVITSILDTEPRPLRDHHIAQAAELQRIVSKALHKDPAERYENAGELLEALKNLRRKLEFAAELERWAATRLWLRWRRSPVAIALTLLVPGLVLAFSLQWVRNATQNAIPEKSIAVLPFANLSADPENAYFADGVREEILTRLSKVAALKVISRASAEHFASASADMRKISRQLGVAYILQGSVRKTIDEMRVSVQLIDARRPQQLWAESYNRKLSDIFQVETEIARNIAGTLEAKLTHLEAQAVAAQPTGNSAAYELYLRANYFLNKRNAEGLRKALDLFTQAIRLDPHFARAYAGIADTYGRMPTYDLAPAKECLPLARAAALKALELDDDLAEAHAAYAGILSSEYQHADSRAHFERAIELDPNNAIAHETLGLEIFMNLGQPDRGLAEVRRAQALDPLSLIVNTALGMAYYRLHEYDQAIAQLRKTLELDPNFHLARQVLAQTLDMQGRFDEAISECQRALETSDAPAVLATLAHAYAREGNSKQALNVLQQLKAQSEKRFVAASNFAWAYLGLGNKEEALNWLEKGYEDGSLYGIKMDPFFDPLRGEPRFEQLIARVFPKAKGALPAPVAVPQKSIAGKR